MGIYKITKIMKKRAFVLLLAGVITIGTIGSEFSAVYADENFTEIIDKAEDKVETETGAKDETADKVEDGDTSETETDAENETEAVEEETEAAEEETKAAEEETKAAEEETEAAEEETEAAEEETEAAEEEERRLAFNVEPRDVDYDLSSKWNVDYPELAEMTTEGITVEVEKGMRGNNPYPATITYTIPEGFSGDISMNAMMDIQEAMGGTPFYLPGDKAACVIKIINNSGREYAYANNSFVIATENNEAAVVNGVVEPVSSEVEVRSFDNTLMPLPYTNQRVKNTAIQALYGVTASSKVTAAQMKDAALDEKLKGLVNEEGLPLYPEGIQQLNQYYIDFYNDKYNQTATKLEDFSEVFAKESHEPSGRDVLGGEIFGGGTTNILEKNPEIAATSYNYFYNHLLVVYPVDGGKPSGADWDAHTVGGSMRVKDSGTNTAFETVCQEKWGKIEAGTYEIPGFMMGIHGPATGNAYQGYNFGYGLGFSLVDVVGDAPLEAYALTINYFEKSTDKQLRKNESQLYTEGGELLYDVTALVTNVAIDGYTYESWESLQQAQLSGIIAQDLVFNVYYAKNESEKPTEPENPGNGGNGGGNGGGNSGGSIGGGDPTGPGMDIIEDSEVPLGAMPSPTPSSSPEVIIIDEEEVPLASLPKTGEGSGKSQLPFLLTGLAVALYQLRLRKRETK